MDGKDKAIDPWLAVGAALYWGSIVACFLFPGPGSTTGTPFDDSAVKYLLLGAFVAVGFAFPRLFSSERGRSAAVSAMLAATLAAVALPIVGAGSAVCLAIAALCHLFAISVLMVLWGFAFASMDKRHAGQNVTVTMLLSVGVVLIEMLSFQVAPIGAVTRALMVASAFVLLSGTVRFRSIRREKTPRYKASGTSFFLSRFAFGAVMGFGIVTPMRLETCDVSLPLAALALAAVALALVAILRSAGRLYFALPTLLMTSVVVAFLPLLDGGLRAASEASVGLIWLVWASFSAFQLSDLKERCGTAELPLCLAEKLTLSISMVVGVLVCRALAGCGLPEGAAPLGLFMLAATGALVLGATYASGCLVGERAEDTMREELARSRRQHSERAYDEIAAEFGLSAREREVMGMLAEGYTRAFIRDTLGISDGTAKAHIAHVYSKMDIHHKDDLLEFVDSRVSKG